MSTLKINQKELERLRTALEQHVENAISHGVVKAKSTVNVDTTSLKRSIRILPKERRGNLTTISYIAGGTGYDEPLNDPVDYAVYQEEIWKPFMLPSVNAVTSNLSKSKSQKAFRGDGEHYIP